MVGIYGTFALTANLNIGHRHLLPIYPALCILAGGAAFWFQPLLDRMRTGDPQGRSGPAPARGAGAAAGRSEGSPPPWPWALRQWQRWPGMSRSP